VFPRQGPPQPLLRTSEIRACVRISGDNPMVEEPFCKNMTSRFLARPREQSSPCLDIVLEDPDLFKYQRPKNLGWRSLIIPVQLLSFSRNQAGSNL